jgi:hypothetical protein
MDVSDLHHQLNNQNGPSWSYYQALWTLREWEGQQKLVSSPLNSFFFFNHKPLTNSQKLESSIESQSLYKKTSFTDSRGKQHHNKASMMKWKDIWIQGNIVGDIAK